MIKEEKAGTSRENHKLRCSSDRASASLTMNCRAKVAHRCLSNPTVCSQCLGAIWEEQALTSNAVVDPYGVGAGNGQLTSLLTGMKSLLKGEFGWYASMAVAVHPCAI